MKKLKEKYQKFHLAEGNRHIASEFAVQKLSEIIISFRIKKILEIGLGIGSISGTLLEIHRGRILNYSGTENNYFCLEAVKRNLGANYQKLNIYPAIKEIPADSKFDLIIVDGKDQNLREIEKFVSPNGIIGIEGDRLAQQEILQEFFPRHKFVHSISLEKNLEGGPFPENQWQGGLKIIFVNPSIKQKAWWMKEKIMTKLKYQYPGRHFGNRASLKKMKN